MCASSSLSSFVLQPPLPMHAHTVLCRKAPSPPQPHYTAIHTGSICHTSYMTWIITRLLQAPTARCAHATLPQHPFQPHTLR
jgi:hypothetical protein